MSVPGKEPRKWTIEDTVVTLVLVAFLGPMVIYFWRMALSL